MPRITSQQIKRWGRRIGFDLVGVAPALPVERQDEYHRYLAKGYHGEMSYLARNVRMRLDPRRLVPGARSIICTATNYYTGDESPDRCDGRVARYAWGRDYHVVLKERLAILCERIREAAGKPVTLRRVVDTAPLDERRHAARAGLGWIGKNGLLINEQIRRGGVRNLGRPAYFEAEHRANRVGDDRAGVHHLRHLVGHLEV